MRSQVLDHRPRRMLAWQRGGLYAAVALAGLAGMRVHAQAVVAPSPEAQRLAEFETRLNDVTKALA